MYSDGCEHLPGWVLLPLAIMCMSLEQSLASSKASFGLLKFGQEAHHGTTVKPEGLADRRWSEVLYDYH